MTHTRPYTLTPNPANGNIQIIIDGVKHGECISYLLADKMAQEILNQCSTPACTFTASYQCSRCQKSLCPAHAINVGQGFIYCGICAPSTTRHTKKATFEPLEIITNLSNATREELGIRAWYVTTEEKPAGSRRTVRKHQGFVQGPDMPIQDLGFFDYALQAEQAVNHAATALVHELALVAA